MPSDNPPGHHNHNMLSDNPPRHRDHFMPSDIPPRPSDAYHQPSMPPMPSQDHIPFPPPSYPPHPSQAFAPTNFSMFQQPPGTMPYLQASGSQRPQRDDSGELIFNLSGGFPMMGDGLGTLLGNPMMNLFAMGASRPRTDSHTGPVGIERLLHMVPTTQDAFKEMKNLMVIRGENPLQCFDQEHLIEQWTSRKSDVDTMLNAIAKKPDHLQGVNVEELTKKAPEEQGLFLLKSLLKHVDSDPNIQMLAYLKQHNFLKRVEPHTPPGSTHSPEGSNTPVRSNTPTTFTGTDPAIETLERASLEPDNRSGAESLQLDSGIQPDLKGDDDAA